MIKRWVRDESGQSLLVIVISMSLIVGLAAFAIDAANWFVARHQAQVSADAAVLAGANCMADGGTATMGSGSTNCLGIATSSHYAPAGTVVCINDHGGLGMVCSNQQPDPDSNQASYTVEAWVGAHQQAYFSSAVGVNPMPTYTKSAVATYIAAPTSYALFAGGDGTNDCSGNISFSGNGNGGSSNGTDTLTGGIHANGDLTGGLGSKATVGAMSYGCANQLTGNGSHPSTVAPIQTTSTQTWPVPYDSSSCVLQDGKTGCYFDTADISAATPTSAPWCTYIAGSTDALPANVQYSASSGVTIVGNVGSSSSPVVICDPGGTITFNASTNTTIDGTLYAANFVWAKANMVTLTAPSDRLGIYYAANVASTNPSGSPSVTCSSTTSIPTLTLDGNKFTLAGATVYAPCANITLAGNSGSNNNSVSFGTGFVEAENITVSGNNWTLVGDGPTEPGDYGDALVQ